MWRPCRWKEVSGVEWRERGREREADWGVCREICVMWVGFVQHGQPLFCWLVNILGTR